MSRKLQQVLPTDDFYSDVDTDDSGTGTYDNVRDNHSYIKANSFRKQTPTNNHSDIISGDNDYLKREINLRDNSLPNTQSISESDDSDTDQTEKDTKKKRKRRRSSIKLNKMKSYARMKNNTSRRGSRVKIKSTQRSNSVLLKHLDIKHKMDRSSMIKNNVMEEEHNLAKKKLKARLSTRKKRKNSAIPKSIDKMINNATQNIIDDVTKNVITDTPNNVIVKYADKVIDDKIENDITDTPKNVIDDVTENVITDTPKNVIDDMTENFISDTPNNFIKHESIRIRVLKRKKVRKLKKKQPSKI